MVIVKFKTTSSGVYGLRRKGQTAEVQPSIAKVLEKEGIAEILTEDDGTDTEPVVRGGVRITDVTGQVQSTDEGQIIKKETVIKPEDPEAEKTTVKEGVVTFHSQEVPVIKTEPAKPEDPEKEKKEQAETPKKEVKETPKKEYK